MTKLTVAEAAAREKKSTRTIRRYIASGRLRAYRVGPRDIRILEEDLDALMCRIPAAQ